MRSDEEINKAISSLTNYLVVNYRDTIKNLAGFYRKFVYDPSECEEEQEDDNDQTDDF